MSNIRKFLVALSAAIATSLTVIADGNFSVNDGLVVALAFLSAAGVYQVTNTPTKENQ